MKKPKARIGRPPGNKRYDQLIHVRIPGAVHDEMKEIAASRRDQPDITTMVREALAMYVEKQREILGI